MFHSFGEADLVRANGAAPFEQKMRKVAPRGYCWSRQQRLPPRFWLSSCFARLSSLSSSFGCIGSRMRGRHSPPDFRRFPQASAVSAAECLAGTRRQAFDAFVKLRLYRQTNAHDECFARLSSTFITLSEVPQAETPKGVWSSSL